MVVLEEAVEYIKALDLLYPEYNLTYVDNNTCYLDEEENLIAPQKAAEAGLLILNSFNEKQLGLFIYKYNNRTTLYIRNFIRIYHIMQSNSLSARLLTFNFESITQEECVELLTSCSDNNDVQTFNTVITEIKDNEIQIKQQANLNEAYQTYVIYYLLSHKGDKFNIHIKDVKGENEH